MNNLQLRDQNQIGTVPDSVSGPSEVQVGRSGQPFSETSTAGPETVQPPYVYIAADLRALAFPVTDLRPDPANARQHGDRDVAAVAASLRAHGQRKAIVGRHRYRGLPNFVLAGCGTLQAARLLKWSHIAVAWYDDGSDDEAREYAIRDNRTQEQSQWNVPQLAALASEGVDLLALGWSASELGDLFALADADAAPLFSPSEAPPPRLDVLEPHCATCRCREVKS